MYDGSILENWNFENYLQAYCDYCQPGDDYWIAEKTWDLVPDNVKKDVVMAYCEENEQMLNEAYKNEPEWEKE